jgi:hypothetical protein
VLKRLQCSLTSIIHISTQQWFNANNERLLIPTRCSTALSKFGVVSNKIPRYLKVCTLSIVSPLNTNSWHGSKELKTMAFVFFTFMMSPHLTHNCWSMSNYYYNPTSDSNVRTRSSTKNSIHMCMSARANASHSLLSKRPSKASKYNLNSRGLRGQPCFTPCWHLKLEVMGGWCVRYHWHTSPIGIVRSVPLPQG